RRTSRTWRSPCARRLRARIRESSSERKIRQSGAGNRESIGKRRSRFPISGFSGLNDQMRSPEDFQRHSGDRGGVVGGQKQNRLGDVAGPELFLKRFLPICRSHFVQFVFDGARGDGIDGDVVLSELALQVLSHVD